MKLLILTVVIFLQLVTADDKFKVREDIAEQWDILIESHTKECVKESGENEENVRDMYKKGYFPNTTEFKHYAKCLTCKLNLMNGDGAFNEESLKSSVKAADLDILEESLAAVKDEKDINEKIYLFGVLFIEKVAKRYPPQH